MFDQYARAIVQRSSDSGPINSYIYSRPCQPFVGIHSSYIDRDRSRTADRSRARRELGQENRRQLANRDLPTNQEATYNNGGGGAVVGAVAGGEAAADRRVPRVRRGQEEGGQPGHPLRQLHLRLDRHPLHRYHPPIHHIEINYRLLPNNISCQLLLLVLIISCCYGC